MASNIIGMEENKFFDGGSYCHGVEGHGIPETQIWDSECALDKKAYH